MQKPALHLPMFADTARPLHIYPFSETNFHFRKSNFNEKVVLTYN